ncbi:MAG TPA: hypothetical protein VHW44_02705, partial [Pseudonocardiaceae bacterium]|nr:hypothetical protein [Pseudonocardiaceae bacterium]
SGRRFVLVVAPDKSTVFPQHLPAGYADKECAQAVLNPFWSQVTNVDGAIDLRAGLQSLARSGPVYYPQDTHWDDQGALYMLRSVVDQIDPTATTNWRTQPAARVSGPADLAALTGQPANEVDQTYRLFPDGVTDRTGKLAGDLSVPMTVHSTPTAGMVSGPVTVLGDSFLIPATRYLPAAFSDVTELNYGSAASEPGLVESAMTTAKTVVLEVVERNLTAGTAPVLEPQVIAGIRAALASHPMR